MDAPNALKHDIAASSGVSNQSTVLSPHAATFVAAMANESNMSSVLSPHATPFVAKSKASKLSPHAATFAATPAAGPTQGETVIPSLNPDSRALLSDAPQAAVELTQGEAILSSLDPALRALLSDAVTYLRSFATLKRKIAAIGQCQATLGAQHHAWDSCDRHYVDFIKWRYFERYDKPCTEQDIESAKNSADAQEFRCVKCADTLPDIQRALRETQYVYVRLVAEHDAALDDYSEVTRMYNASVTRYYAHISGRSSHIEERVSHAVKISAS
jgi:hypothetical protein